MISNLYKKAQFLLLVFSLTLTKVGYQYMARNGLVNNYEQSPAVHRDYDIDTIRIHK